MAQRARKRRSKQHSNQKVFDHIIYDSVDIKEEKNEWMPIKRSRRRVYRVNKQMFTRQVSDALRSGKFVIKHNYLWDNSQELAIKKYIKRSKKYTVHSGKYKLLVKVLVVYGSKECDVVPEYQVDICGVREYGVYKPFVYTIPELAIMVNYYLLTRAGTHTGCLSATCYGVFSCDLFRGVPVPCSECKLEQCLRCNVEWAVHGYISCETFQHRKAMKEIKDPVVLNGLFNGTIQACPQCYSFIEKDGGCNKITCSTCGEYWCWACGEGGLRHRWYHPYDHYVENPTRHKGKSGNEKRCPVGGEFSPVINQNLIERNIKAYPDRYKIWLEQTSQTKPLTEEKKRLSDDERGDAPANMGRYNWNVVDIFDNDLFNDFLHYDHLPDDDDDGLPDDLPDDDADDLPDDDDDFIRF